MTSWTSRGLTVETLARIEYSLIDSLSAELVCVIELLRELLLVSLPGDVRGLNPFFLFFSEAIDSVYMGGNWGSCCEYDVTYTNISDLVSSQYEIN